LDALNNKGLILIKAWQNQTSLKIVISDDGPGIPAQIREKIFDPFFTTKDTGQGSGLGLFIVHDIIVQHGGTINVDNGDTSGAAFTIILPVKENS
jgi:signal transduction histidine kinase